MSDEMPGAYLPATCAKGHVYTPRAIHIGDRGRLTLRTGARLPPERHGCPECGSGGTIAPGMYTLVDGEIRREDVSG